MAAEKAVHTIVIQPGSREVGPVAHGETVLRAALEAGVDIVAPCGGSAVCGRCRIKVLAGEVDSEPTAALTREEWAQGWRLACRTRVLSDVEVEIPEASRLGECRLSDTVAVTGEALMASRRLEDLSFGGGRVAVVKLFCMELCPPCAGDNLNDLARFKKGLESQYGLTGVSVDSIWIRNMPAVLRHEDWVVTATVVNTPYGYKVINVESGRHTDKAYALALDIGTNTEICLNNFGKMRSVSCPSGPAFEGAGISQGISGCSGAVEKVSMTEDGISYKVIGGVAPKGLCGSGLIDAVAILLREGVIDGGGRMLTREECTDERIKDRLSLDDNRINRFLITDRNDPVYLTQKDVRAVQLATGAVKAGTEVLMEKMGVAADGIDEVLLAGAFGSNIDISNAMTVGLIPKVERERVRFVFNSSGLGACMAQASEDFYRRTEQTMGGMEYIELSSLQDFQDRFIRSLTFA